jgi:hypothetical protein
MDLRECKNRKDNATTAVIRPPIIRYKNKLLLLVNAIDSPAIIKRSAHAYKKAFAIPNLLS